MRSLIATAALLATALPAAAVQVRECDFAANVTAIVEPWEQYSRTFAKGTIRVALVDTWGEPACCSSHLLIIAPDSAPEGGRLCRVVGDQKEMGFQAIDFSKLTASYDPKRGLLLTFPYKLYVDGEKFRPGVGRVRVNVAKGTIKAE